MGSLDGLDENKKGGERCLWFVVVRYGVRKYVCVALGIRSITDSFKYSPTYIMIERVR